MKKLIAMISTVAIFATMSLTTMAAADVSVTGDITNDNGTYTTATEATAANGQTTIIAVKGTTIDTNSIQYINQGTEKNFSFQLKDAEALAAVTEETTINVYVGGDKITKTPVGTIVFTPKAVTPEEPEYMLGDVYVDEMVDDLDIMLLDYYYADMHDEIDRDFGEGHRFWEDENDPRLLAADVYTDGIVDDLDIMLLDYYYADMHDEIDRDFGEGHRFWE